MVWIRSRRLARETGKPSSVTLIGGKVWAFISGKGSPKSLVLGLAALLVALGVITRTIYPSRTECEANNSDRKFLQLKVRNKGGSPSTLISYRLEFPRELMIETTALQQASGDTVIEPVPEPARVYLTTIELTRACNPATKRRYLKTEIAKVLEARGGSLRVTLYVKVQESGQWFEIHRQPFVVERVTTASANLMKAFILGRIPDVDDEDVPCAQ
ncbi:MAG: hypothetical protein QOC81_438 [Thermoanaerobaculia bacterium]|jgi:hypothetical protein|nr:hypothetical protein [Thermoanaerobaculia bacterium]